MPQAGSKPTTSRRAVALAGAASFAAGFACGAVLPAHQDSDLLTMLARFDALELRLLANPLGQEEDTGSPLDLLVTALHAEQAAIVPLLCTTPTRTPAALRARAQSLLLWAPDLFAHDPERGWDHNLNAAILRGALEVE